jgi:hypothetical protein
LGTLIIKIMTQLLEEAINKVKQLDPAQQDDIAAVILAELEQANWDKQIEQDLRPESSTSLYRGSERTSLVAGATLFETQGASGVLVPLPAATSGSQGVGGQELSTTQD